MKAKNMKQLIKACRRLDRRAQRQIFNELSPYLFVIAQRYADSQEDAKDILQESFISIFNNIEKCKATEAPGFKSWCKRIVVNKALEKQRQKGVRIKTLKRTMKPQQHTEPKIDNTLNAEDIMKLLDKLPVNQRLVFNLIVIDGYNHKEVAQKLNIKESSSRTLLTRARQQLQTLIKQDNHFPINKTANL